MKAGWERRRLSDVVRAKGGNNQIIKGRESNASAPGLVQGYSASGPDVWVRVADYSTPGVVLSAVGARCGKTFMAEGEWTAIANTHVLLPSSAVDVRWLWYLTNDESFWVRGGSAQPFVKVRETLEREQVIPPLPEQQRIVSILDEAFEGIEKAKANAERNLASARAAFRQRLNAAYELNASTGRFVQLSALCDIKHGYAFDGSDFSPGGGEELPIVITPGNFSEEGLLSFTERNTKRYTGSGAPPQFVFEPGDLVVVMTDLSAKMKLLGRPAFVDRDNVLHNQRIGRIVVKDTGLVPEFLYFYLLTDGYLARVKETSTGTMVRHTAPQRILACSVFMPATVEEQSRIVTYLTELREVTSSLRAAFECKLALLAELKKSLLHRAFAGEL